MWIAVLIVVVVVSVWLGAGGVSQNSSPPAPPPADNCAACRRLDAWWNSLNGWGKFLGSAWYLLQKTGCAIKGCK